MALGKPTLVISMKLAVAYVNGITMSIYERPLEFLVVQIYQCEFCDSTTSFAAFDIREDYRRMSDYNRGVAASMMRPM
jgi:hypothetical protein